MLLESLQISSNDAVSLNHAIWLDEYQKTSHVEALIDDLTCDKFLQGFDAFCANQTVSQEEKALIERRINIARQKTGIFFLREEFRNHADFQSVKDFPKKPENLKEAAINIRNHKKSIKTILQLDTFEATRLCLYYRQVAFLTDVNLESYAEFLRSALSEKEK